MSTSDYERVIIVVSRCYYCVVRRGHIDTFGSRTADLRIPCQHLS